MVAVRGLHAAGTALTDGEILGEHTHSMGPPAALMSDSSVLHISQLLVEHEQPSYLGVALGWKLGKQCSMDLSECVSL